MMKPVMRRADTYLPANGACSRFSNVTVETIRLLPGGAKDHLE
jgi:hypothetical protein